MGIHEQLLQISGWAFLGLLVFGLLYMLMTGFRTLKNKWDNAFNKGTVEDGDRYMTLKETTQLINQLNTQQEEPLPLGPSDSGKAVRK